MVICEPSEVEMYRELKNHPELLVVNINEAKKIFEEQQSTRTSIIKDMNETIQKQVAQLAEEYVPAKKVKKENSGLRLGSYSYSSKSKTKKNGSYKL